MTLTLPDIVPTGYAGDKTDFALAKVDRSGAMRRKYFSVTIPLATATGKYVGLVPFNKGARLAIGSPYIENVGDGSFTFDIGVLYYDSSLGTTDDDAFCSAMTTGQAGGLIVLDEHAWIDILTTGDGWIVLKTGGSTTDAAGVIKGHASISYDN
jgi:hypothetical protein